MNEIIRNAILYYPKVQEPAPNYGKTANEYSVQVFVDKDTMKKLKAMRLNKTFKSVDDEGLEEKFPGTAGKYMVKFSMPEFSKDGKPLKPGVFTADGKQMTDLIGNGSVGDVKIFLMEGTGMSKGKVNARLSAVRITELVEYEKKGGGDDFDFSGEMKRIKEDAALSDSPF